MKMLIFQPPNIVKTPLENGLRSLKKQRGFKRSLCASKKKASPIDFFLLLFFTRDCLSLRGQETLPFIQSRTSPVV